MLRDTLWSIFSFGFFPPTRTSYPYSDFEAMRLDSQAVMTDAAIAYQLFQQQYGELQHESRSIIDPAEKKREIRANKAG